MDFPSQSTINCFAQETNHLVVLYLLPGPYSQEIGEFLSHLVTHSDEIVFIGDSVFTSKT